MILIIESELGKKADIKFMEMQPGDVECTFADIEHSRDILGYNPLTPINIGIPKFIKWLRSYAHQSSLS